MLAILHHLSYVLSPFICILFLIGDLATFALAGLELLLLLPLSSEWLGLQAGTTMPY
jgi:hypothetical protein